MESFSIVMVVLVALVVFTVFKGVRIVPQGYKWVVQRLGKYSQTLEPGLNLIIPYVDDVSYKVTTKDIVLDIPSQEVITRDNVVIIANAVAYINIIRPDKAVYGIEDYEYGIRNLVQTSLRSIIGEMDLDSALSSRDEIKMKLKHAISEDIADWGITLKTVEIQDINPSQTMQASMEEQAAAERLRRATVTRADGQKQAAILEADGRLEASRRDAEAQVVLAKGSEESIRLITAAMGTEEMPIVYLLGEQYIKAIRQLAESDNSKMVVLPADILSTVKGMVGDKLKV
ncbi:MULTISPECIES: SPFH domain-containing protein [Psychrobacter]|uniref:SPFH domain, Band 7 family protein n=1 Tax=Psychrobacter cryohalolentis (strain ATCC BAA-1226 / DSM 17306 / VKM B-2378 / K5) TaxID=335284 RepID=Q1Q7X5_PSYCK|nr:MULTISPECIES: SPFH domain-containing protein [Psychrobacter]ABE76228.1 SPFH domain, Band 7 family protein [Psychrobacter cryohalolentis K5]ASE26404.1 SPFH/Band 7/PHB domain protein [Psychrobacter cryohalolentis]KAA0927205.1 SPFH/Band 7/PHB domain protein [Psychrobacter sp. ANT_H56B]KAA0939197.1 SPFH/Band 7/PHB domain protein [Psychrobacter sp. ANT_H59]MBA2056333.1 SPFH/Band 7/PHB domain protein [Psychrobacter sp. D2]|tara:strand:- start:315 stop:1175 length:861 start_codon:yes stop_codon:yes gene_type:complete